MLTVLLLTACNNPSDPAAVPAARQWVEVGGVDGTARSLAVLPGLDIIATDAGLLASSDGSSWSALAAAGLPDGTITFVDAIGEDALLVWVHGGGLYRSTDAGASFAPVSAPPVQPLMSAFNPRGEIYPTDTAVAADGRVWLTGIGGLFYSDDLGDTFTAADLSGASFNVLFTGVDVQDEAVFAVSQLADSILPSSYQGLLSGVAFYSDDGGESFESLDADLAIDAPTGAAFFQGRPCLSAIDGGALCYDEGSWAPVAGGGPPDAVGLLPCADGLSLASATQGLWRWDGSDWQALDVGAVADMESDAALASSGVLARLGSGEGGTPPESAEGTVHIALSFHTNLYHSYRGDSNDDDGYGQDIRVIRAILDWLDEHPDAHGEWDIENHFSLDGWLATEAPDILERIGERVDAGQDDIRLMSWNNGAMASSTEEEFVASVQRGIDSNAAAFSEVVPGVQPQECMFTPDHIGWYRDLGIEWVTLFYAANGFTALRQDIALSGAELYNPLTLSDAQTGESITWVPAYHHADVLEHGGLSAWAEQIRRTTPGDSLLLIHFDADAESWENFGLELEALSEQVAAGEGGFTNIQTYLDAHEPVAAFPFEGDVADGTGDGFQSWAEKDFNHDLATAAFAARELADQARVLGAGDAEVEALLDAALTPRLLTLSTTHFGLAAPYLHADRVASAWAYADAASAAAQEALDWASALHPVPAGTISVLNHRDSSGTALVELALPGAGDGTAIYDEDGVELPALIDGEQVSVVLELAAGEERLLTYALDADGDRASAGVSDAPEIAALGVPWTACGGAESVGVLTEGSSATDARGVRIVAVDDVELALCDGMGAVTHQRMRYDGLPGTVLAVSATMGEASAPDDAESVVLSPLSCAGEADAITWQAFGGSVRTRPMRPGVDTWNGQAVDGWMSLDCADGTSIQISHRVSERSSLALAPVQERGGVATIAPLGTIWGSGPWHDGRLTGGTGYGEVVTALVGSQYRPAAPDWSGQEIAYRLLVGEGIDAGTLDLFAHPPLVRIGL